MLTYAVQPRSWWLRPYFPHLLPSQSSGSEIPSRIQLISGRTFSKITCFCKNLLFFSCSNIFKCIIYENTWENLQPYFSCISLYPTKYQIRLAWQLSFLFDTSLCVLWYSCNEITMDRVQLFSTEISENKLSTKICHICNKFSWSHDSLSVYLLSGLQTEPMNLSLDEST